MLRKIKIKSNVNRLKSAMHCHNVINTEKTELDKITLSLSPWQSQIKDFKLADREFDLTGNTHHCFWSWWASPRSCSAPTGRNVPQTWSLLDYFLRSECLLGLWVTAELPWARAGLGSADPDINTEPGQATRLQLLRGSPASATLMRSGTVCGL